MRKILNASLGLVVGVLTLPLMRIAWPIFLAWWCWQETDDG